MGNGKGDKKLLGGIYMGVENKKVSQSHKVVLSKKT